LNVTTISSGLQVFHLNRTVGISGLQDLRGQQSEVLPVPIGSRYAVYGDLELRSCAGQPISTGIETDDYSLQQIADVPSRTHCPVCGLNHTWWKREAWLADQPDQPLLQSPASSNLDKTA